MKTNIGHCERFLIVHRYSDRLCIRVDYVIADDHHKRLMEDVLGPNCDQTRRAHEHKYNVTTDGRLYRFNATVFNAHTSIEDGFTDFVRAWMFYHERRCCGRVTYV